MKLRFCFIISLVIHLIVLSQGSSSLGSYRRQSEIQGSLALALPENERSLRSPVTSQAVPVDNAAFRQSRANQKTKRNKLEQAKNANEDPAAESKKAEVQDTRIIAIWVAENLPISSLQDFNFLLDGVKKAELELDFTKQTITIMSNGISSGLTKKISRDSVASLKAVWQKFPLFKDKLLIEVELIAQDLK